MILKKICMFCTHILVFMVLFVFSNVMVSANSPVFEFRILVPKSKQGNTRQDDTVKWLAMSSGSQLFTTEELKKDFEIREKNKNEFEILVRQSPINIDLTCVQNISLEKTGKNEYGIIITLTKDGKSLLRVLTSDALKNTRPPEHKEYHLGLILDGNLITTVKHDQPLVLHSAFMVSKIFKTEDEGKKLKAILEKHVDAVNSALLDMANSCPCTPVPVQRVRSESESSESDSDSGKNKLKTEPRNEESIDVQSGN